MATENLRDLSLSVDAIQGIWESRRSRMRLRRAYFEPLWRSGVSRFFEGIVSSANNGSRPLYNSLYEQYDTSLFSRDGLRFNQLRYPLIHALTMRAMASEIPNKPRVNFIAVGSNDPTKPAAFRHLFNQVLYEMEADQEDFEIFLGKRIEGSAIVLQITEQYNIKLDDPTYNPKTGEYTYKEKEKKIRQCLYKKLDLRHVLLDEKCTKTSLSDCNYATVDEYFSPEEALQRFADPAEYDQAAVKLALQCPVSKEDAEVYEQIYDVKDANFIKIEHCFDKIADRYHILMNRKIINKKDSPIPRIAGRRGKMIPLSLAIQYKIPGAPYGYGDSHVTSSFNSIKNLMRLMVLEITQKAAKPMMAVDPLSSFDEQGFEWGQDFIRVSPNELKEIKITPDLSMLYKLDETTDNDIMRVTGLNINDTSNVNASETARKTIIRRESQNALIELSMNYMSASFFSRLYTLLKDDIKLHYGAMLKSGDAVKVKTRGEALTRSNGGFDSETVSGFRYFDLKPEDIDFDVDLDLELGNIASSRELDKALQKEGIDSALLVPNGFSPDGLARYIAETNQMPDYVLNKPVNGITTGDPKDVANAAIGDPSLLPAALQEAMKGPEPAPGMPPAGAPAGAPAPEQPNQEPNAILQNPSVLPPLPPMPAAGNSAKQAQPIRK